MAVFHKKKKKLIERQGRVGEGGGGETPLILSLDDGERMKQSAGTHGWACAQWAASSPFSPRLPSAKVLFGAERVPAVKQEPPV